MELINIEFNPFDIRVVGFDYKNKEIKIKLSKELIYLTYIVSELELLKIMAYELEFDEICKLLESRIVGKFYSENLKVKFNKEVE